MLERLLLSAALALGAASGAFSQAPNPSPTIASSTIANLRSDDEKTRQEAAQNLFYVCDAAPDLTAVVNGIGPLLLSPDAHVKLAVLACFEKMDLLHPEQGPAIAKFKAALMKGMEDPLEDVRQYSLAVLGATKGIAEEDQKTAVLQGLVDQGHKVRRIALGIVSYKKLNDPEIITATVAVTSAWPKDLRLAIEALGNAAPADPRAVRVFITSLESDLTEVKAAALTALSKTGRAGTAALPRLKQMAADPGSSDTNRKAAIEAIRRIE
jgi:HEAT repeat protein